MEKRRIYILSCITFNDFTQEDNSFILGVYASQKRANEEKEVVTRQAEEEGQDLRYEISDYIVIE